MHPPTLCRFLWILVLALVWQAGAEAGQTFLRADANGDGAVDTSDAIFGLDHIFNSGPGPCEDAIDSNDDGAITITDAVHTLFYLFLSGPPPAAPFTACGLDPTQDNLDCLGGQPGCPGAFTGPILPGGKYFSFAGGSSAIADFNGDLLLDILSFQTNGGDTKLGNGDGTFQPRIGVGATGEDVAIGDLNGDGILDGLTSTNRVLEGVGDGTFVVTTTTIDGNGVALGDLNGDLVLDAIVVWDFFDSWFLYTQNVDVMGNGDLTFTLMQQITNNSELNAPFRTTLVDLDGDGNLDAIAGVVGGFSVAFGNGDGTMSFDPADHYDTGGFGQGLATADVNLDGEVDVIVAIGNRVVVAFGSGIKTPAGSAFPTFLALNPVSPSLGQSGSTVDVAVGDMNGDTHLDIVSVDKDFRSATVFLGDSTGIFARVEEYLVGTVPLSFAPTSVDLGDFDQNGTLDVAIGGSPGNIEVYTNPGDGRLIAQVPYLVGTESVRCDIVDLNGDGDLDVVTINGGDQDVTVNLGNGDGTFGTGTDYHLGGTPRYSVVGDFTGDLIPDVIYNDSAQDLLLLPGVGDGSFAPVQVTAIPAGTFDWIEGADVDADGALDLILPTTSQVSVHPGHGDGTFAAPVAIPALSNAIPAAVGDVNGDGSVDLLIWGNGSISTRLNDGAGGFATEASSFFTGSSAFLGVELADMNSDGLLDLVVANDMVRVYLGNGDGTYGTGSAVGTVGAGHGAIGIAVADFDSDCNLDVLAPRPTEGRIALFRGNGDGTMKEAIYFAAGVDISPAQLQTSEPVSLSAGDLNGDGRVDVVVVDDGGSGTAADPGGFISVLLNQGPAN